MIVLRATPGDVIARARDRLVIALVARQLTMAASVGVLGVADMLDTLSDAGSASIPDLDAPSMTQVPMGSPPCKRPRLEDDGDDVDSSHGCEGAAGNGRSVKCNSKVGIGVRGILICEAAKLLGSLYN